MNKELLQKYFQNNCSPEELTEVEEFLRRPESSDLIQQVFDEDWTAFESPELKEDLLNTYRQYFVSEREQSAPKKNRPFWRGEWLRYAAVLLLTIGVGYYAFLPDYSVKTTSTAFLEFNNPPGQRSVVTLSDSTVVYLGAGSRLKLPQKFTGNTREITLEGEAFFQVKKDSIHPFIVHTGTVQTKVLGTSFKIEAFTGHLLSVSVATGKVRVDQNDAVHGRHPVSLAVLTPGDKVVYNQATKKAVTSSVNIADLQEWKNGRLIFNGLRLDEASEILERQYNVQITITSPSIAAYKVSATFTSEESIAKVMRILSATARFNYNIKGDTIKINKI